MRTHRFSEHTRGEGGIASMQSKHLLLSSQNFASHSAQIALSALLTLVFVSPVLASTGETRRAALAYGKLPLSFERNEGQTDPQVAFVSRGAGYTLFLTQKGEAVFKLRSSDKAHRYDVLKMSLVDADKPHAAVGESRLGGVSNYFMGNDPQKWHSGVGMFGQVAYKNVYKGVDVLYYGNQKSLEYDFHVAPGASTRQIGLSFDHAEKISLTPTGDLAVTLTHGGTLVERAPVAYQWEGGRKKSVSARFQLETDGKPAGDRGNTGNTVVRFALGEYDHSKPLIIDPVLDYSTYLGGTLEDSGRSIAVDSAGCAYITGRTNSYDYPLASAYQSIHSTIYGADEVFVTKFSADGQSLVYSTYLGGTDDDVAYGIAVDSSGCAYITGSTRSTDFPLQNAYQSTPGIPNFSGAYDAFVTKFSANGQSLVYSTYLGGTASDYGRDIAVDSSGYAYVTGDTNSNNFPTTSGAYDTSYNSYDAFVTKFNTNGQSLAYSTYLGGTGVENGNGIAVDSSGYAYIVGTTVSNNFPTTTGAYDTSFPTDMFGSFNNNIFVTKLNTAGTGLTYSTYLGGYTTDYGYAIAVDSSGCAYVTGATNSYDFPTTSGVFQPIPSGGQDVFVTKFNSAGTGLSYSTIVGGGTGYGVAVDGSGNAYLSGETYNTNFPTVSAVQTTIGGISDAFMTKVNSTGTSLLYSTYLGGANYDTAFGIAIDSSGYAYATGETRSTDFPTQNPYQSSNLGGSGSKDAFVTKL
jgi:hypothetical protein